MGEIAEMMLDGTLCEMCGVAFDPDHVAPGYPVYCSRQCASDRGAEWIAPRRSRQTKRLQCQLCKRMFASRSARRQHAAMKHGEKVNDRS